jgi:aryl-alcohol dehydrogenase-like predicted oxidoreductase
MMEDNLPARHPVFADVEMGIGTWAWGDKLYWGFGQGYGQADLEAVFDSCISMELNFFDTAEIYGQGLSESFIGQFVKKTNKPVKLATKFMPFPWRLWRGSLLNALRGSLKRLGREKVDLYQMHIPLPPVSVDTWMDGMSEAYQSGLVGAVGVSNYDRAQMLRAYDSLAREGIALASNQMEYSLINRKVEKNGLLKLCHERGITLIAYSPLGMGLLTGKYTLEKPVKGMRGRRFGRDYMKKLTPLMLLLRQIGDEHEHRSPAQVALNWVICKGALPIPGAKTAAQAEQNAGALRWRLTDEEVSKLDEASDKLET